MKILVAAFVVAVVSLPLTVGAAAKDAIVEPVEAWSNVFGDSEVKLRYTVGTPEALDGRIGWSLSVNRRIVEHGELPLRTAAGEPTPVAITLRMPEVKDGIVLEAQLTLAVYATGEQKRVAEHVKTLWIFPRNPFVDRSEWLKGLKITLFDPEGKTADVFDKAGVPFTFTKNTSVLDELSEGILVIGEGTAWKDYRSLGESMVKTAARGVPVLCLAAGDGTMSLPGAEGADLPSPKSLSLRQEDIIAELDKRLDYLAWPPEGTIAASRLLVSADRDQVLAEVTRQSRGWPWLEARYTAPRSRLLICGFGIIRQWEVTPTPRYLLSELFVRLTADKQSTPSGTKERKVP